MIITARTYLLPTDIELPNKVDLGDGVIIRELTDEEKSKKIANRLVSINPFDFDNIKYCIELTKEVEEVRYEPFTIGYSLRPTYKQFEDVFDRVLLTLRLFKSGSIGFNEIDMFQDDSSINTISRVTYFWGDPYILPLEEVESFISLYNEIKDLPDVSFIKLAMERFRTTYEREKEEDRLIDIFIALESIFLGDSNAELTYRLALGVSCYLHSTHKDRREAFEKLKKAYNLRSKIVHGSYGSSNSTELKNTLVYVQDCLRECIKKILPSKQGRDRDFFLEYIQEQILS